METFITYGLQLVGIPAATAIVAAYAALRFGRDALTDKIRASIGHEYARQLEAYKDELKTSGDKDLERHKHELTLQASRHDMLYSKLQEKRSVVIAQVYATLTITFQALKTYTADFSFEGVSMDDRHIQLYERYSKFSDAFTPNAIYFPAHLTAKISAIHKDIRVASNHFYLRVHTKAGQKDQTNAWIEISDKVEGPIKEALGEIETEFRKLMGVES